MVSNPATGASSETQEEKRSARKHSTKQPAASVSIGTISDQAVGSNTVRLVLVTDSEGTNSEKEALAVAETVADTDADADINCRTSKGRARQAAGLCKASATLCSAFLHPTRPPPQLYMHVGNPSSPEML